MNRHISVLFTVLSMQLVVTAQTPTPNPILLMQVQSKTSTETRAASQSASCQGKTFALEGTVVREGAPVAKAEVVIVNTNTKSKTTTRTDEAGRFSVADLSCGPYDISITAPGLAEFKKSMHLDAVVPLTFSMNSTDPGIDPPENTGGGNGGEVPVASADTSGGQAGGGGRARTEARAGGGGTSRPSRSTAQELSTQTFATDLACSTWLDARKTERKRLASIIPISEQTSIFVLETVKENPDFRYTVLMVNESLNEQGLLARVRLNPDKTLLGIHRLTPTSYLMVFHAR